MKSAIDEILSYDQSDNLGVMTPKMKTALDKVIESERALSDRLKNTADASKLFQEYQDSKEDVAILEYHDYYKAGFRLGFRLAMDIWKTQ